MTESLKAKLEAVKTLTARRTQIWSSSSDEILATITELREIDIQLKSITESLKHER